MSSSIKLSGAKNASGRAVTDERGNSVWEWQVRTGMFVREACSQRLKQLTEEPNLSMLQTGMFPAAVGPRGAGAGFNPYDHSGSRIASTKSPLTPRRMRDYDKMLKTYRSKEG